MHTEEAIRSLAFFQSLNQEQVAHIATMSHIERFDKGCILYYENTSLQHILFLLSGLAKSYKIDKHDNEIFLYHIRQGSLLSEFSSLTETTLLSYANTMIEEPSQLLSIEYRRFKKDYIDTGILSREVASEILQQSQKLQAIINREFIFDSVAKVAMMLDEDVSMFNRLKRYDVSLMLHIQPATLSRVLNRLKRDEIIDIDKGNIFILDPQKLQNIYKGFL
jgi:CRP/FNR family transcriptional regulator